MHSNPETGAQARAMIRSGHWRKPTASLAPGFVQANLVVLPEAIADDFELLCARNPGSLPLLERLPTGSAIPSNTAKRADLRTDLPRYRVYRNGLLIEERDTLSDIWQPDWVAFLLGCSFTFDFLLKDAGIGIRHVDCDSNVPMYITNRSLESAGCLSGPLVVSMRPIPARDVDRASALTAALPLAHGAPVHAGSPSTLGIALDKPDFGDAVPVGDSEVPVFWGCGVTSQAIASHCKLPLMVTHAPGYMLVTDLTVARLGDAASDRLSNTSTPSDSSQQRKDR